LRYAGQTAWDILTTGVQLCTVSHDRISAYYGW
jgi:hypothetical protein